MTAGLLGASLAAAATGCGLGREFRLDPTPAGAPRAPAAAGGGAVVPTAWSAAPADGTQPAYVPTISQAPGPGDPAAPAQPPRPLPQPQPVPQAPGQAQAQPPPVQPAGAGMLSAGYPRAAPGYPLTFTDPHVRATPTVTGGRLELAPYEVPTDRVIDLTRQLEIGQAQNRDLLARIKDLETVGVERDQRLAEATREVEIATADAARSRAALQAAQAQVIDLQDRIREIEREDVELLKKVIELLGRLLGGGQP
jgi:hypothetical protein